MDKVRFGIIGVGGMGTAHAGVFNKGDVARGELVAVCDIDPARMKPFGELKTYTDSRALIRSGEVDAVIIATPHYDHTTIGIDALEQGLHVLVEKPISVHKADAEKLIAAHTNPKQIFSAMFQMRTYPQFQKIKQLVESGELGTLHRMNWVITAWYRTEAYYASGGWRATWKGEGGGVLLNQCPHNLDLFQWICGKPKRVQAFCGFGKYHTIEVEDEVTAYFEYDNGATAVFIASTGEAPGTDRLEIAGDRGKLVFEDGKLIFIRNEVSASEFNKTSANGFDRPAVWNIEVPIQGASRNHADITENFVDAVLDGKPLIAPAEEGIHSVEIANAMLYSAWIGQKVELPIDGRAYEAKLKEKISASRFEKKAAAGGAIDLSGSFR
ncbi:MAG TPA: Gfo/Idh/MocA family oxidoreductase [Candidatus Hydrogenedentes bacterium]|nr:Gfo/Idh/MocA family oxidoreductase [Candidatus Hydrogenedentota bacterium]